MKYIELIVNPDGSSTVRAVGFKGKACLKALEFLQPITKHGKGHDTAEMKQVEAQVKTCSGK